MVEAKDEEALRYVNSEMGFGGLRIVKGVDRLIYTSNTNMEEGHQYPTIEHTICIKMYLWIPIALLDLEVKPYLYPCLLSIISPSKSMRTLLY